MGGVGKTQLAQRYVHNSFDKYKVIGWINAENTSTIRADLTKLALELGLVSANEKPDVAISHLYRWLAGNGDWLLVFDNALEPKEVQPYLPSNNGKVLITSQHQHWRNLARPLKLEVWQENESSKFLRDRLEIVEDAHTSTLADLLGHLPLALEQAAAYIEQTSCGIEAYIGSFNAMRRELWKDEEELWEEEKTPLDYKHTVATTWNLSMRKIREQSPDAADLINLLAFLAPDNIPIPMLKAGSVDFPNSLREAFENDLRVNRLVRALTRYSLVIRQDEMLSVHRLVQTVIRDRLAVDGKEGFWLGVAVSLVHASFEQFDDRKLALWWTFRWLIPHAEAVIHHANPTQADARKVSELLYLMGLWYNYNAQKLIAISAFYKALKIYESYINDPLNPFLAALLAHLGESIRESPKPFDTWLEIKGVAVPAFEMLRYMRLFNDEMLRYFERAVEIERHNHSETQRWNIANRLGPLARFRRELACGSKQHNLIRATLNTHKEAIDILETEIAEGREVERRTVELSRQVLSYANSLRAFNKLDQAKIQYERALGLVDKEDVDVPGKRQSLGFLFVTLGEFKKAEDEFREALKLWRTFLPEDHYNIIRLKYMLGQTLRLRGVDDEAEVMLSDIPSDLKQRLLSEFNSNVVPCLKYRINKRGQVRINVFEYLKQHSASKVSKRKVNSDRKLHQNQTETGGNVYTFPESSIPGRGSDPCPCGSGVIFARCHKKDFRRAVKAGITQRG